MMGKEDESAYKCSATSQAKTTSLWRKARKTEAAGRGVCHKPAKLQKTKKRTTTKQNCVWLFSICV